MTPSEPLTLQTDASLTCLGRVILQDGHTVYISSKSLKLQQKNICYNLAEPHAVAWAMENFYCFLAKDFSLKQTKNH